VILGKQSSQQVGSWFAVGFLIASLAKIVSRLDMSGLMLMRWFSIASLEAR